MNERLLRVALCCNESPGKVDGIRDYTVRLAEALAAIDNVSADLRIRTPAGRWATIDGTTGFRRTENRSFRSGLDRYDAVVVQYNPFMYGRWGFAPWLPIQLWRLRSKGSRGSAILMVHEPYVPMVNWRWTLMGLWQRCQLTAALWGSKLAFASIEAWASSVGRLPFAPETFHLPVGSNLPDMREAREVERAGLQADDDTLVVASFSTGVPGRLVSHLVSAVNAIARTGQSVLLLNLGAGAHSLGRAIAPQVKIVEPDTLTLDQLAAGLAASDLFLAPFVDGVSTRRTTFMAALQHGLAVIGTKGFLTDEIFLSGEKLLKLVPVDDKDGFCEAAVHLALDPDERHVLGVAGRQFYERAFDWPVIANTLVTHLKDALGEGDSAGLALLETSIR